MSKVRVSVVILSWNTREITDQCLVCLKKAVDFASNKADVEVVVVDNASEDGSPEMIAKKHHWVTLVKSKKNLGYARGNNLGFKRTDPKSKYVLLLNNDVYVRKSTILNALNFMEDNPQSDALGCRLEYGDGKFQPSAGFLPNPSSVWSWIWGLDKLPIIKNYFLPVHPKGGGFFSKDRQVGWIMGAFVFMRREVFEKTKGFDENFFMYMEEVEWCRRVQKSGFKIWYTPRFSIIHLDKASSFGDPQKLANIFRREILGIVYYLRRHYPRQVQLLIPVIKMGVIFRWLVFSLLGNKLRRKAYWQTVKEL